MRERSRPDGAGEGRARSLADVRKRAEEARDRERASLQRAREARGEGHAFAEHRDVTLRQLERRIVEGVNARGLRERRPPSDATRWRSDRALVRSADAVWRSDDARAGRRRQVELYRQGRIRRADMRFSAVVPLRDALGPGWRDEVEGRSREPGGRTRPTRFSSTATVMAVWRVGADGRWHLVTCFPKP